MDMMQLRFELLSKLAGTICDIDENKLMGNVLVQKQISFALSVVGQMKGAQFDVGTLDNILSGTHASTTEMGCLPNIIENAHEEIHRLLGSDAWRVYSPDC